MPRFSLEWRQTEIGKAGSFVHHLAYATSAAGVKVLACRVADRAWRGEFRQATGGHQVFTDIHQIRDWIPAQSPLPRCARVHLWRMDLECDLVADQFVDSVTRSVVQPVAAGVLTRATADALVRFARESLRRPGR